MHPRILPPCLLVVAGVAVADSTPASRAPGLTPPVTGPERRPPPELPPIDLATVPEVCHAIAQRAGAASVPVALSARITLASCLADAALAPLALVDCEDSLLAVDAAAAPSFELLGGVLVAAPDDTTRIVAEQARAELYNHMTARMLATLPPPGVTASAIGLYTARKDILDELLARWRDGAAGAYEHILAIVEAAPRLARDPVVANAARAATDRLRVHVARRRPQPPVAPEPRAAPDDPVTDTGEALP